MATERCGRDAPEMGIADCGLAKPCPYHDAPLAPIEDPEAEGFHEEPEGPAPEWLKRLGRVDWTAPKPYLRGKRGQFLVVPALNLQAHDILHAHPDRWPEVDLATEDGADDSVGWVYRVRVPRRAIGHLQRTPGALAGAVKRVLATGILDDAPEGEAQELWRESVLHLVGLAMEAAATRTRVAGEHVRRRKRERMRYVTGLGDHGDPGEVVIFDTIEDAAGVDIDVTVRCYVTCRGRGEDADLEAEDFEVEVDGVKLPDALTDALVKAHGWEDRACDFDTPWGWIKPGIYVHDGLGRFEVLGAFKEPGVCTGLAVVRPVGVSGLPRGGWRLADLGPFLHEELRPEHEVAKPGELGVLGAAPAPAPDTQAGPWEKVEHALSSAVHDLRFGRRPDPEEAWPLLREAQEIAYREAKAERDRRAGGA